MRRERRMRWERRGSGRGRGERDRSVRGERNGSGRGWGRGKGGKAEGRGEGKGCTERRCGVARACSNCLPAVTALPNGKRYR